MGQPRISGAFDLLALERKARLATERSAAACAGLEWKSQKIDRRMGDVVRVRIFHAAFFSVQFGELGFRLAS